MPFNPTSIASDEDIEAIASRAIASNGDTEERSIFNSTVIASNSVDECDEGDIEPPQFEGSTNSNFDEGDIEPPQFKASTNSNFDQEHGKEDTSFSPFRYLPVNPSVSDNAPESALFRELHTTSTSKTFVPVCSGNDEVIPDDECNASDEEFLEDSPDQLDDPKMSDFVKEELWMHSIIQMHKECLLGAGFWSDYWWNLRGQC